MAQNPKVVELEEKLRIAKRDAENEKELRNRALGKLEKYEEKDEDENRMVRDMRKRDDEYRHQLESDVAWMRRLVEFLCIPTDKLKEIQKFKEEITMSGDPRYPGKNY